MGSFWGLRCAGAGSCTDAVLLGTGGQTLMQCFSKKMLW